MGKIRELNFVMKYEGKTLRLDDTSLYPKLYAKYNFKLENPTASIQYAIDAITFSEAVQEFEIKYKEHAFTKSFDRDPELTVLFLYFLNTYTQEDNFDAQCCSFYDWCEGSLEEIQELIDDDEYEVCDRCKSILQKEKTVTINGGLWKGNTVCFKCSNIINAEKR